jgi:hypothetical protein
MLEEFSPLSPDDFKSKAHIQQELLDILDKEESFRRQRSREN